MKNKISSNNIAKRFISLAIFIFYFSYIDVLCLKSSAQIIFYPSISVAIDNNDLAPAVIAIKPNSSITLHAKTVVSSNQNFNFLPYEYNWYLNDSYIPISNASDITVSQPGIYYVKAIVRNADSNINNSVFVTSESVEVTIADTHNNQALTYTTTTDVLKPNCTSLTQVASLSIAERSKQITYLDGLARPIQTIQQNATPSHKDLVTFQQYDQYGNAATTYLPYSSSTSDNTFRTTLVSEQANFYDGRTDRVAVNAKPYGTTQVESSPLQRLTQSTTPGDAYSTHPSKLAYQVAEANSVRRWVGLNGSGFYDAGELQELVSTDADGRIVRTFQDQASQVVLQRKVNASDGRNADTYTVYAENGQIQYIIPPAAIDKLIISGQWNIVDPTFKNRWLYQYTRDTKGRLVERRFPGADPVYIVYDAWERPVLTQDGNRRANNVWYFTKYDARNRPVLEGIYTAAAGVTRADLQTQADNWAGLSYEDRYQDRYTATQTFPAIDEHQNFPNQVELTRTFYDDYTINPSATYAYIPQGLEPEPKATAKTLGLTTVVQHRIILDGSQYGGWLTTAMFYDEYGNVIQKQSNNHLNINATEPDVTTLAYREGGFTHQVSTSLKKQRVASTRVVVKNRYSYDDAGRLLDVWQQHLVDRQPQPEVLAAHYTYNELGQLVEKNLHSRDEGATFLQSEDFSFDINGQLKAINNSALKNGGRAYDDDDDIFGLELIREQTDIDLSNTARFDGGISLVKWQTRNAKQQNQPQRERSYSFDYDGLGRLTNARFQAKEDEDWGRESGAYDERDITYDANGNILTLKRYTLDQDGVAPTLLDNLTYSYGPQGGNKLQSVLDRGDAARGFRDNGTLTNEYSTDANGNILRDDNKGVDFTYNILNKVERQQVSPEKSIVYHYDGAGTLLHRTVNNVINGVAATSTFDYIDGFAYESHSSTGLGGVGTEGPGLPAAPMLASVPTPEGRAIVLPGESNKLVYEYHMRDHLGNLRVAFRAEHEEELHLTMEVDADEDGNDYPRFRNVNSTRSTIRAYEGSAAASVSSSVPGPHIRIPVEEGDKVQAQVYAVVPGSVILPPIDLRPSPTLLTVAPILLPALPKSVSNESGINFSRPMPGLQISISGLLSNLFTKPTNTQAVEPPSGLTKSATIAWQFFDENDTPLEQGYEPVDASLSNDRWHLISSTLSAKQKGYLLIELINDNTEPAYFDELIIKHPKQELVISQENHYYPFGMALSGVAVNTQSSQQISKTQFNSGSELQDELLGGEAGIYSTYYRSYDPTIGRFLGVDPLADKYADQSVFSFSFNDPINFSDPTGAEPNVFVNGRIANPRNVYGQRETDGYSAVGWMGYQGQSVTANGQQVVIRNNTLGYLVPERYTGKGFGAQAHFVSYNLKALSSQSTYDPYGQWTKSQILDGLQDFLDAFGLIPGAGEPADGLNAIISYSRGKKAEAALSAGAMIPFVGWAATGGKVIRKLSRAELPAKLLINSKQMGKKFTKHMKDYPGLSHLDYKELIESIYHDPASDIYKILEGSATHVGETHIVNGENLLRLDPDGNFRSLYPAFR